ncbi:MAG: hypothetical protein ACSW8G_04405 [Bacillota bacterium]
MTNPINFCTCMESMYKDICDLFELDGAEPLTDRQIEDIREYFGGLPKALESYYRTCGGCREMNASQDFLLTADGTYQYKLKTWDYDDYCVFYVENQCVSVWAFRKADVHKDDPPVFETYDDGKTWFETCDRVSRFLVSHAYLHAAFSFEVSSGEFIEVDGAQAQMIAERFPHADADSGLYSGVRFYRPYPDTVVALMKNGDDGFIALVSSRDEEHFDETDDIIYGITESE